MEEPALWWGSVSHMLNLLALECSLTLTQCGWQLSLASCSANPTLECSMTSSVLLKSAVVKHFKFDLLHPVVTAPVPLPYSTLD